MTKATKQDKTKRVTRSNKTTLSKINEKNISKKSIVISKATKKKKISKTSTSKTDTKRSKIHALQAKIDLLERQIETDHKVKMREAKKKLKKPLVKVSSKIDKSSKLKTKGERKISQGRTSNIEPVVKPKSRMHSSIIPVGRGRGGKAPVKRSVSHGGETTLSPGTIKKSRVTTAPDKKGTRSTKKGDQVAYVHVGEGGERDLQEHLRGNGRLRLQVLDEESLPDLDCSDLIHGLDQHGTSRDYVEESHRCSVRCPVGCQGHLRPNEVVVYSGWKIHDRLVSRTRWRGRFVTMDGCEDDSDVVTAQLDMGPNYRRIGGRSSRRRMEERRAGVLERNRQRRLINQQRFRRTMEEDRDDTPIPPVPARLGLDIPQRVRAILDCPPVPLDIAEQHGWNPADRSFNVELKEEDPLVMRRRPVAQSTDCIRAKTGYTTGLHVFEITWPVRQRGTHAVVGIANLAAPLHAAGYQSLIGNNPDSWGWDLGRKKAFHGGESVPFPPSISHHHQWTVPDTFHLVLDMDQGELSFLAAGELLGTSHTGVVGPVYPVVSTVWGHCEVRLRYLGSRADNSPLDLQELVRGTIRGLLSRTGEVSGNQMEGLGLPRPIENYLLYK